MILPVVPLAAKWLFCGMVTRFCPHMLYCDQRSQKEETILSEKIDPLHFYEITGHRSALPHSIEKLMRVKKHEPEILHRQPILNAKDYITSVSAVLLATDPRYGTNAYDLEPLANGGEEISEVAGLDLPYSRSVHLSIDVIGEV